MVVIKEYIIDRKKLIFKDYLKKDLKVVVKRLSNVKPKDDYVIIIPSLYDLKMERLFFMRCVADYSFFKTTDNMFIFNLEESILNDLNDGFFHNLLMEIEKNEDIQNNYAFDLNVFKPITLNDIRLEKLKELYGY